MIHFSGITAAANASSVMLPMTRSSNTSIRSRADIARGPDVLVPGLDCGDGRGAIDGSLTASFPWKGRRLLWNEQSRFYFLGYRNDFVGIQIDVHPTCLDPRQYSPIGGPANNVFAA
jgi:hypothetical protein